MNLIKSQFSIHNKERRDMDFIKGVYKRRVQPEIESYKNSEDEDKRDTMQVQDILMIDKISIQYSIIFSCTNILANNLRKVLLFWKNLLLYIRLQDNNFVNKEERKNRFKSMTRKQRQELILKKMKAKGIEVGSGVPNKKYESEEVYELIHIASRFPELRKKGS